MKKLPMRLAIPLTPLALMLGTLSASTQAAVDCSNIDQWSADTVYSGQRVQNNDSVFQAKWWSQGSEPDASNSGGDWLFIDDCQDNNQLPDISFMAPANGAMLALNNSVDLLLNSSDSDGTVTGIAITANGSPIQSPWTPTTDGEVTLVATATDNDGATNSSSITVTVSNINNQSPEVAVIGTSASSLAEGQLLSVSASASDPDSGDTIARVALLVDGNEVASTSNMPYNLSWTAANVGSHSITLEAYDQWVNPKVSASMSA